MGEIFSQTISVFRETTTILSLYGTTKEYYQGSDLWEVDEKNLHGTRKVTPGLVPRIFIKNRELFVDYFSSIIIGSFCDKL